MEILKWIRVQWDRVAAVLAFVVGVLMLVVGWIDVSGTAYVAKQIPYVVSAGLGGIAALLIGGTLWLSADLRDEWRALDRLEEDADIRDRDLFELDQRMRRLESRNGHESLVHEELR
jgi:hypothetical protein